MTKNSRGGSPSARCQAKKFEAEARRTEVEIEKLAAETEQLPGQTRKTDLETRHLEIGLFGKLLLIGVALGVLIVAVALAVHDPSRLKDSGDEALRLLSRLAPK